MGADAFENVAQVGEWIDAESFARGDEASQHRRRQPAVVAPIEHPVSPTYRDSTQTSLGTVVVDRQVAVFAVAPQRFPVQQRVSDGLPLRALRQHVGPFALQICLDISGRARRISSVR